mgnify:FL=1
MNNENNISVISLSKYTTPSIEENKTSNIVEYGSDNNYFQYLIDRSVGSTTNNAIIRGVANMVYGKGLDALDSSRKTEQYAAMKSLLKPQDVKRVISDRKKLGMGALQITYKGKKVDSVSHFPMETLRAGICNDEGVVDTWYYHPNWVEYRRSDKLQEFPIFGSSNNRKTEIYIIQAYSAGFKYYSPCDYVGALPYAVLEEEIADYLINDTLNGFSGTKVVNFNNGIPDVEKQRQIKRDINNKLTGARGEKVIVAFNNDSESATTVTDLPLDNAPEHYQYLSDECRNKLITGHNITSPLLIGVRETGGGLGSNADEIKNSSLFFDNIVIKPLQEEILEAFNNILSVNDISLKLYFKTIQPLEFIEADGLDKETKEEETGIKATKMAKENEGFDDEEMLDVLRGETMDDDDLELIDVREVKDDNESIEDWVKRLIKETTLSKFNSFIKSDPNGESTLDKSFYKIRYTYQERYKSDNSRKFCKTMMSRTGRGVVYRKEDIDKASFQGVNKKFGHKGQNYSLFRFKGGVNCGHFFQEQLYRVKSKSEKYISRGKEQDSIPSSYTPKGKQYSDAKKAPRDMPNNGHHPNYGK